MAIREKTTTGYLERDPDGNIVYETGTTVPTDATAGYAKGAMFVDSDAADGTSANYVNVGTTSSSNFDLVTDAA